MVSLDLAGLMVCFLFIPALWQGAKHLSSLFLWDDSVVILIVILILSSTNFSGK
jgi:hypothetical protein